MIFAMDIDHKDHDLLLEIEGITDAFSRAVAAHIDYQPSLKAAFKENSNAADDRIFSNIINMRVQLPNPYEAATPADRTIIELQHSILNSQESDHHIAIAARFLRPETLAGLMPQAALAKPALYTHAMEKYGMRQSASVLNYKYGVTLG